MDFLTQRLQRFLVGQQLLQRTQQLVEQTLMPALLGHRTQKAGGERRHLDAFKFDLDALADEAAQARLVDRDKGLRQQLQHKARQCGAALSIREPVGDLRGEIDIGQLFAHRLARQEISLDETAEIVGDALMVSRDDRGVRDRQAERTAEQGDHGIPVGQAAHGRRRRESRDVAPGPMCRLVIARDAKQRGRHNQQQRRRDLDAPQFTGAPSVARVDQLLAHTSNT